jgi:hypothetical protein
MLMKPSPYPLPHIFLCSAPPVGEKYYLTVSLSTSLISYDETTRNEIRQVVEFNLKIIATTVYIIMFLIMVVKDIF